MKKRIYFFENNRITLYNEENKHGLIGIACYGVHNQFDNYIYDYKYYKCGEEFPDNVQCLGLTPEGNEDIDLEDILVWYSCLFRISMEKLNEFIVYEQQYENCIINSEFNDAKLLLDSIERRFGYSIWLIENRIAVFNSLSETIQLREYIKQIMDNPNVNGLVKYIVTLLDLKSDNNITIDRYNVIFNSLIDIIDDIDVREYLRFRMNFFEFKDYTKYKKILKIENKYSLIDRYITYCKVCHSLVVYNKEINEANLLISTSLLYNNIVDKRIENLYLFFDYGIIDPSYESTYMVQLFDNFYLGKHEMCIGIVKKMIENNVVDINALEIAAKCIIKLKQKTSSIHNSFIYHFLNVILKNQNAIESFRMLQKICLSYQSSSFCTVTYSIICKEFCYNSDDLYKYSLLNCYPPSSYFYYLLQYPDKVNYLNKLNKSFKNSTSIKTEICFLQEDVESLKNLHLDKDVITEYSARICMNNNNYYEAKRLYKLLAENKKNHIGYQIGCRGIVKCFIELGEWNEAITSIVSYYLENPNILNYFPIDDTFHGIENRLLKEINLDVLIFCDLYIKNHDIEKEFILVVLNEEFLQANEFKTPSCIFDIEADNKRLIYYLYNVCRKGVLEKSIYFANSEMVDKERVQICRKLIEIDEKNSNIYGNEIINITRRLDIQTRTREVDKSKIHVDIEGLIIDIQEKLIGNFNRLMLLLNDKKTLDRVDSYNINISENNEVKFYKYDYINELKDIYVEIRDMFLYDTKYGLNCYLSTRIRHGTLLGQIRKSFEKHNLITTKSNDGNYLTNEYWKSRIISYNKKKIEQKDLLSILHIFDVFSYDIDNLITKLRDDLIQIRTEKRIKKDKGFFDYSFNESILSSLLEEIPQNVKFESFIKIILDKLWMITDNNLIIVRNYISNDLLQSIFSLYESLQRDLHDYSEKLNFRELENSIINSRTETQHDIEKILSWFTRTSIESSKDFQFESVTNVATDIVKRLNNKIDLDFSIHINDCNQVLKGSTFYDFVDILCILIGNSINHHGLDSCPVIYINIASYGTNYQMKIYNRVHKDVLSKRNKRRIMDMINSINTSDERVMLEGGTGFIKLKKILEINLGIPHNMEIDFKDDEDLFIVTLSINVGDIIVKDIIN